MSSKQTIKPKSFSKTDNQESAGNLLLQNLVSDEPRVHLILGGNDKTPNRDGFIELRNSTHGIGKLELQVKPVDSRRKKRPCFQLHGHLVAYSQIAGLPFILICYDLDSKTAYWKKIDDSLFKSVKANKKSITILFEPDEQIGPDSPYLSRWQAISKEHLEVCDIGPQFKAASSILGLPNSPQELADLIKQLLDKTNETFRVRLQGVRNLLGLNEPGAATRSMEQLKIEILSSNYSQDVILNLNLCLGSCYTRLEDERKAEIYFRKALEIDSTSSKAQSNLAHVLFIRNSENKEALELARRAYNTDPTDEFATAIYILCLGRTGQIDTIKVLMAEQSDFFYNSSVIQMALAQDLKGRGRTGAARPFFERCVAIEPSNLHARILRAETIFLITQDELFASRELGLLGADKIVSQELDFVEAEALIVIEALATTSDKHALMRAYELCALTCLLRSNPQKALNYCDKTIVAMPNYLQAYETKSRCLFELSDCEKAIEILQPFIETVSRTGKQTLAYSSYRLANYTEAAKYFGSYIQLDDTDREWFLYLEALCLSDKKEVASEKARFLKETGRLTHSLEWNISTLGC